MIIKVFFRRIIQYFRIYPQFFYKIEEIHLQKNLVILRCAGARTVLKLTLEDVIADSAIINGLCPEQACILGGCYGRLMKTSPDRSTKLKNAKEMTFLLSNKCGRYVIRYLHRNGEIEYYNKKTHQEFTEHPLTIVNNHYIIAEFDPTEACYIGILAGSSLERAILSGKGLSHTEELIKKPPKLRIVN